MFARVTEYKMKPGSKDAAAALMNSLKDQIMGMSGMHNFVNVMNEDGYRPLGNGVGRPRPN